MRLLPTPEQAELRHVVRRFLEQHSPPAAVRAAVETDDGYDTAVWARLTGELGVAGLAVSEDRGGAGAGVAELAVAMEECGAALLPGPLLGSAVICGLVLDAIGDTTVLPKVAGGTTIAAFAEDASLTVAGGKLSGCAANVLDGMNAHVFVAVTGDGVYAVDATAPGLARSPLTTMDLTRRQAKVTFADAAATRLGDVGRVGYGLDRAAAALAAEQLGVMRRSVEMAVGYAKQREQFGRPIGSFQAVKHGLADIYVSYELAIGVVAYAAWAADNAPDELPAAASLARAYLSPQSFEAAFQMIQYHGGIGYTWEHDAHLYYKRAKANETLLGEAGTHLERLAAHLLDEAGQRTSDEIDRLIKEGVVAR